MAKTSDHDERDDEDLEGETSSEADEDEDEEGHGAHGAARRRAHAAHGHGDDHDHDHDHDHEAEEEEVEDLDDPYWWTPHAVLSGLVVVGVLGFFGAFNKVLGFAAAVPEDTTPMITERSAAPQAPRPPALTANMRGAEVQLGAKQILVAYKGSVRAPATVERSKDDARERAAEVATKAKDTKNSFEDLVKQYSDDAATNTRGGDLGRFARGAMVPELQAALEKLRPGEVSDAVETPSGFYVLKRTF